MTGLEYRTEKGRRVLLHPFLLRTEHEFYYWDYKSPIELVWGTDSI